MKTMFVAVEFADDDKTQLNDEGSFQENPKEAWEVVSHLFSPEDSIIYKVIPVFKIKDKRKFKLTPINKTKGI